MPFTMNAFWIQEGALHPDQHAAFRAEFVLEREAEVEFRSLACGWFLAWLDGALFCEGPARYPLAHPEYMSERRTLSAGRHVLAIHGHHVGVPTRQVLEGDPFIAMDLFIGGEPMPLRWKARAMECQLPQARRASPLLSWIEWRDTRREPDGWRGMDFDDSSWAEAARVEPALPDPIEARLAPLRLDPLPMRLLDEGMLSEEFGYELDDPPMRFALRDLAAAEHPPQGVWRRYDLGRVRLGHPRLVVNAPAGAVVEIGLAERLQAGRVVPAITLSGGPTANMDHFVARGGEQEILVLTPRGGRFLEVHVLADPNAVRFVDEGFVERGYYAPTGAAFSCGDELLERVWTAGVETFRACAEDALVDTPVRERGQWTGDAVSAGLEIAACSFGDLRLVRRSLQHAAQCARPDGLVAGMCPGGEIHMLSYAAQWSTAVWRYHQLTGEAAILREMLPAAQANMDFFLSRWTPDGITSGKDLSFIDWGYIPNDGPVDIALNIHILAALETLSAWLRAVGQDAAGEKRSREAAALRAVLEEWFRARLAESPGTETIGYHAVVLGLLQGLVSDDARPSFADRIAAHQLDCFPNNPDAPRLSDPGFMSPRLITPYFNHFAYDALIREGRMGFVLEQIRSCYGWALGEGRTTLLEVFDTRWSHSHQWGGCPTWILSRHGLGLHPRFDLDHRGFQVRIDPGSLESAKGRVPVPGTEEFVDIRWKREGDAVVWEVLSPIDLSLLPADAGWTIAGRLEVLAGEGKRCELCPAEARAAVGPALG